ncbi:MAG: VTT domain-containing protein [Bacteroidota bacterium]|nr:VTT domain-containing protein [Bacteroidota bacterium]
MTHLLDTVLIAGGFLNNMVEWILKNGGLFFLLFIVFAETGLFIGFFLPGDSLLFAAGIYLRKSPEGFYNLHFLIVALLIIIASALGNMVGYWFGLKTGPAFYHKKDSWYFKKKHLQKAQDFYNQYGKGTVFLAKFVPIVRTFAPIVAGIVKMERAKFIFYNIVGSVTWVLLMVLGGYFLEEWVQRKFGISLTDHIEMITLAIILITTLPILYKLFFAKKHVVPTGANDKDATL